MNDDATLPSVSMVLRTVPEHEAKVSRLAEFFAELPDGAEVTWQTVERSTSVGMTKEGRDFARRALRRLKRPYESVRGLGLRLSSADRSLPIMMERFRAIDSSVSRADRTRRELAVRHLEAMEEADRRKMLELAGFFGAVRAISQEHRARIVRVKAIVGG